MKEKYKYYIDVLNVISCLSVVILHTNNAFWKFSYESYWISANFIECIFYFAVPVFFMITGVTTIDYREKYGTRVFLKKRIQKSLIPFVLWSMIATLYFAIFKRMEQDTSSVVAIIDGIINTKYVSIYWFFIGLFSLYLVIPVISLIPKEKRIKCFFYIIVTSFMFNYWIPFMSSVFPGKITYNGALKNYFGDQYIFYALCGYLIDNVAIEKRWRYCIYGAGFAGLIIHIFGTWYLSYRDGYINGMFKGYMNVPCIVYSIAIFLLIKSFIEKRKYFYKKIISFYNGSTFDVYLMHWYFIDLFLYLTKKKYYENFVYRLFGGIILFLTVGIVVKLMQKNKICRKYFLP